MTAVWVGLGIGVGVIGAVSAGVWYLYRAIEK